MAQSGGKAEVVAQNVTVLANAGGDVVMRVTDKQALKLSSDTGVLGSVADAAARQRRQGLGQARDRGDELMARRIRALVAHDETVPAALIGAHIPDDSGIELAEVVPTLQSSQDTLRRFDADVLLVACREGSTDALELVQWWHSVRVGRPVLVLSNGSTRGSCRQAFAAGADDLVVLQPGPAVPEQNRREVEFAILKAVARSAGTAIARLTPER